MRDYNNELTPVPMPKEEYKPSNHQVLQEYEVKLQFLSRGCIVHLGCKAIAFETIESAMKEVNEYVNNLMKLRRNGEKY